MSKSERLFALLTLLKSKRYAVTAKELASAMRVSERTIYRDIQSLILSGVPISGEAGVGYLLGAGAHLPPLIFNDKEMVALELGMRMVKAWSDKELAEASDSASSKILSVLPDRLKSQIEDFSILVPDFHIESQAAKYHLLLRQATDDKLKIHIDYITEVDILSSRTLQPLGQIFWGKVWTLIAWCELRHAYRNFRLDRIQALSLLNEHFKTSDMKSLQHYMRQYTT